MTLNLKDSKPIIITEPKIVHFHLPRVVVNNLKHEF